jgi:hypothetical protein
MAQQVYTYEQYKPAHPQTRNLVTIHRGTFEENRDSLSPSMVYGRDFYASDDAHALALGRQCAQMVQAEFVGFSEDDD